MVLVGRVNKQIVNGLNQLGTRAVGLSGSDGSLVEARPWGNGSHGLVGDVARVNPDVLEPLLEKGYVPVISSVAATPDDGRAHNINADTVAGELAAALEAEKLILLTDTPGILENRDDPDSLIRKLRLSDARQLIEDGVAYVDDLESYQGGLNIGFAGFTVGGSLRYSNAVGGLGSFLVPGHELFAPATKKELVCHGRTRWKQ